MRLLLLFLLAAICSITDKCCENTPSPAREEKAQCEERPPCEERALLDEISCENERLYLSLDSKGKCRAIELFKESGCADCAIETATCEMAERQRQEYPNQKTYKKQIQEESGQDLYNERFGN